MIEAKELRIGNLVTDEFYDSCKTTIEVDSINDRGINLFIEDDGNYPECAQTWIEPEQRFDTIFGIPLTEEIILDFGYKQNSFSLNFENDTRISIYKKYNCFIAQIDNTVIREIKYVHEWQNLYFDFTNEELTRTK